jgi:hypothetical protein
MMRRIFTRNATAAAVALLFLAACGGGGVPSATSAAASAVAPSNQHAKSVQLSGEYSGPFQDKTHGKGKGSAIFAQQGSSIGGVLTITYGTQTLTESVTQVFGTSMVNGTMVDDTGSSYCSFSTIASYSAATRELKGTYVALHGCSSDHGSFTLHQQCFFKGQGSEDIRPDGGAHPC